MHQLTQCDSCRKHITSNQINLHDKQIKPGIQKRVWNCIHCNHEHLIIIIDKESRRMMKENKRDRERISGINRRAQLLRKQNRFTSGQAQHALKQMEDVEKRIEERIKKLDKHSRKLIDEHKEKV